jgi:hypothetical protein
LRQPGPKSRLSLAAAQIGNCGGIGLQDVAPGTLRAGRQENCWGYGQINANVIELRQIWVVGISSKLAGEMPTPPSEHTPFRRCCFLGHPRLRQARAGGSHDTTGSLVDRYFDCVALLHAGGAALPWSRMKRPPQLGPPFAESGVPAGAGLGRGLVVAGRSAPTNERPTLIPHGGT